MGDQPADALPELAARALAGYLQIALWADEDGARAHRRSRLRGRTSTASRRCGSRGVLAARLREALGAPGMSVEQASRSATRAG